VPACVRDRGTGSYGAGLASFLRQRGYRIVRSIAATGADTARTASPTPSTPEQPHALLAREIYRRVMKDRRARATTTGYRGVNAACESVISTIKNELIKRQTWASRDQARLAIFSYIETF